MYKVQKSQTWTLRTLDRYRSSKMRLTLCFFLTTCLCFQCVCMIPATSLAKTVFILQHPLGDFPSLSWAGPIAPYILSPCFRFKPSCGFQMLFCEVVPSSDKISPVQKNQKNKDMQLCVYCKYTHGVKFQLFFLSKDNNILYSY